MSALSADGSAQYSYASLLSMTNSFNVQNKIGRGGSGDVYLGRIGSSQVAIKVIRTIQGMQLDDTEFRRELSVLSMCRHENIVPLLGSSSEPGNPLCLVYRYMPGGSLADRLLPSSTAPPLTASERIDIAVGIALGLHYLHQPDSERNKPSIFHRDVKSANILLDADGYAKIADAGIAREADSSVTMTGGMGTSGYIDPYYFESREFTTASDVFSFGVVLLELLTGLQAFDSSQQPRDRNLFRRARRSVVPADVRAGFDEARETLLRDLTMECTAEDIEERPGLEDCIVRLLGEVREAEPDFVPPPPPAPAPAPRVREVSTGSRSMILKGLC
jgi:serine/threonine protein kinase